MDAKGESAAMEQNVHDGHRLRVKQRFLAEGLEHYEHHQILEMLLFYGIPRKDTNELAISLSVPLGACPGCWRRRMRNWSASRA